jgi:hypothetical protein
MKFGRQAGMEGDLNAVIFNSIASNILKWFEVQSEVDALPAPFSPAQLWVGIV